MTKTFRRFVLALVVLVAMTVIGCGKNILWSSQLPDQSQYPVLPHRECAKNLETRIAGCRMWAGFSRESSRLGAPRSSWGRSIALNRTLPGPAWNSMSDLDSRNLTPVLWEWG